MSARRRISDLSLRSGLYVPDWRGANNADVLKKGINGPGWFASGETPPAPGDLYLMSTGLLFIDDFTRSNRSLPGDHGWVMTASPTTDQGTNWAIASNLGTAVGGANNDRIHNESDPSMKLKSSVVEVRAKTTDNAKYFGVRANVENASWADINVFVRNNNLEIYHGSGFLTNGTTQAITADTFYHLKLQTVDNVTTTLINVWIDHVLKLNAYSYGSAPNPGWPGLISWGSPATSYWSGIAQYKSNIITIGNLSASQAFKLFDSSDVEKAASATQSGGTATVNVAAAIDCVPSFSGYLVLYDTTSWGSVLARYPVSGNAIIWPGSVYRRL